MNNRTLIHFVQRPWLGVAVATMASLAQPATAEASGVPSFDQDATETAVASMLLISSAIGFGVIDTLYFANDRPMPIGLSLLQIVVAGALVPASAMRSDHSGVLLGAVVSSAWFAGHGTYSIAAYSRREQERERAIKEQRAWHAACTREPEPRSLLCTWSR